MPASDWNGSCDAARFGFRQHVADLLAQIGEPRHAEIHVDRALHLGGELGQHLAAG